MASAVTYSNTKVSDAISSDQAYQSHLTSSGVVKLAAIAEDVADNMKDNKNRVTGIINELGNQVKAHLAAGERVTIDGLVRFEIESSGSFQYEDEAWDETKHKLTVSAIPYADVRDAAKDIVPVNTLAQVSISLLGAQDGTTYEQNTLTIGNTLLAQGKNLQITVANADEGMFLCKGVNEYKGTITANTAGTIDATFPSDIEPGEGYTLEVRGRAGLGLNRSLVTASISNFTVKAAE